jgi:hypothetical protein
MPSVPLLIILHNQPCRRPCAENLRIGAAIRRTPPLLIIATPLLIIASPAFAPSHPNKMHAPIRAYEIRSPLRDARL